MTTCLGTAGRPSPLLCHGVMGSERLCPPDLAPWSVCCDSFWTYLEEECLTVYVLLGFPAFLKVRVVPRWRERGFV